ncbi:MAG: hypothetical protein NPIRA02_21770 [Nitrospirales bacterium]|nr:MAG: hypothetical protein NPIRA02_21770 [Nitrospirales bacterium]
MHTLKMIGKIVCVALLAMPIVGHGVVSAYEEITVKNGATIRGAVTLSGPVPPPFRFQVTMGAYPEHCQAIADQEGTVLLPRARVSPAHEVADVVVFIQGVEQGKPRAVEIPTLTVNRCQFDQLVMAGMDGSPLRILMNDSVLHPLRGWEMLNNGRIPLFTYPNLETGEEKLSKLTTRRSGMVKVECDQHRFMQAWILVPLNPYFATTDEAGHFTITDIPAGTYTISAWHPSLGYLEQMLTLKSGQQHDFSFLYEISEANPS